MDNLITIQNMKVFLIVTICGSAILLLLAKIWKFFRMWQRVSKIPGPTGVPVLGNILEFVPGDLAQNFRVVKKFMKCGRNVKAWFGPFPIILIYDKDDIQKIIGTKQAESRGPIATKLLKDICLNGLFSSEGNVWKRHRKIVQSTFHNNVLKNFVDNFSKNSLILTERLKTVADGESFDIFRYIGDCTFDVLFETAFAYNMNIQKGYNVSLAKNILRINDILTQRCTNPWLLNDTIFRLTEMSKEFAQLNSIIHGTVAKLIEERCNTVRESAKRKLDVDDPDNITKSKPVLLDILISDGQLSDYDIRGELLTAVLAGTETTATTCCYVLCALSEHQQVQERVLQEQRRIFGKDFLRPVTAEDVSRMVYLEQVIKETIRILPPVIFVHRQMAEDTVLHDGCVLPAGVFTLIFTYGVHRDPEAFPDPDRFDPERFSPENTLGRHPCSYIPFGAGRRICVGYKYALSEAKTILSSILRRYRVLETKGAVSAVEDKLQLGIITVPKEGVYIKLLPRETEI